MHQILLNARESTAQYDLDHMQAGGSVLRWAQVGELWHKAWALGGSLADSWRDEPGP
jgi:hypothetical protein